mgnify:CR=1 FL=1
MAVVTEGEGEADFKTSQYYIQKAPPQAGPFFWPGTNNGYSFGTILEFFTKTNKV